MATQGVTRRLAAILAADVVGYGRLMERDEEGTHAALAANRAIIDGLIEDRAGRVFHTAGDSVIAEFASPVEAVRAAVEVQLALDKATAEVPEDRRMRLRIGVHLGDVMVDGEDLIGDGVIVAARLEGLAPPGGLCLSNTVIDQVRDRLGLDFLDLGEHRVKNIARPVQVYRVPLASEARTTSPFRGLDVFEFEHADIFHGRGGAIAAAQARLEGQATAGTAFLLIYGMSGSGKSSLLRAGLVPAVCAPGAVPGIALWRHAVVRPSEGADPFAAVARGLAGQAALPALADAPDLAALLRDRPDRALGLIRGGLAGEAEAAPSAARLILGIDQLEELFTGHADAAAQAAFVRLLTTLASSGLVWVVATMRGDFFHRCAEVPGLAALKDGLGNYELPAPTGPEIAQMIREPARAAGLTFEQDPSQGRLDDVLQQAAMGDPASLPLLEFVLDALYEAGKESRRLTFAAYRALGGLEGAIARRADEVVSSLPEPVQDALPAVLRALATIRLSDATTTARPAALPDAATAPERRALVDTLVDARLLVGGAGPGGTGVVRVVHEALLGRWPRAARIIEADREHLATRARVQADANRWLAEGSSADLLLPPGKRLSEAEDLLRERREEAGAAIVDYVEASTAAQRARDETAREAERRRVTAEEAAKRERLELEAAAARRLAGRTRVAAILTLALAVVAGAGGIIGLRGQQEAQQQTELAQLSAAQARAAEQDAQHQAELALVARDDALDARAEALLNQSVYLTDLSRKETADGNATNGMLLALEALPKTMQDPERPYVVEAEAALYGALIEHREIAVLQGHEGNVWHVAFSSDGSRLVSTSSDKTARVWDVSSGVEALVLQGHFSSVLHASFSPDNQRIATASHDRTARLWDAESGTQVAILFGYGDTIRRVAVTPDGRRVVTASDDGTATVWNTDDGSKVTVLRGHLGPVRDVAVSPDGRRVATASKDGTARLWNATTGLETAVMEGHSAAVTTAVFDPHSGARLLTGSDDGSARLWSVDGGATIAVFGDHGDRLTAASFSPTGDQILTGSADGTLRVWNASSGAPITALSGHERGVSWAAFDRSGRFVFAASGDGEVRVWPTSKAGDARVLRGHARTVASGAVGSGEQFATASTDGTIRLWRASGGIAGLALRGHEAAVNGAVISPDGSTILTTSRDGTARLWSTADGRGLASFEGDGTPVRSPEYSPDGSQVVTITASGLARIWEVPSGTEVMAVQLGQATDIAPKIVRSVTSDHASFWRL